ncbi:MAG TPA: outer membrane beta-barrel protein, partial [Gammaproteobacteria bacterium]|nr:outer membrane beta-barrel protein [Gammaproteobacteria bacterium]
LTGRSSVQAYLASNLTDASSDFLGAAINPEHGDYMNVQSSSDIFRDNVMRLEYNRRDSTFNTRAWSEFRDLDYKEELDDRKVQDYGAEISYNVSPLITTGLIGQYVQTKQTDIGQTNKDYLIGGNLRYNLSRKLSCRFNLAYEERDSTQPTAEYDEFRVYAGIGYTLRR